MYIFKTDILSVGANMGEKLSFILSEFKVHFHSFSSKFRLLTLSGMDLNVTVKSGVSCVGGKNAALLLLLLSR